MNARRQTISLTLLILILAGALAGLAWANYRFAANFPGGNDFLARWTGANAWLVKGISPYDPQVSLVSQEAIYGRPADPTKGEDIAHFAYPLYSMLFFAPFGLLQYTLARALWMTLLEVCLFILALVSLRIANWDVSPGRVALLAVFSLLWYHGVRTVIIGQFAGLNALLIAVAILWVLRGYDFFAGLMLALTTAKPQMAFLLLPFVFLWSLSVGRREIAAGIVGGLVALFGFSLMLLPSWPLEMVRQMVDYPSYTNIGSPLSIIAAAMPGIERQVNLFLHGVTVAYLLVEWALAMRKDERWFLWTAMLTIVVTNLVAFRTATTNYVMMLPALFLVFKMWEERWKSGGRGAVWLSLALLGIGLWALFAVTVQGNVEQPVVYLPLPFFALFGLWWIRWWMIRPPRVLLEDLIARVD